MIELVLDHLKNVEPFGNHVLVKVISNSVDDYYRKSRMIIKRSEGNQLNERSLGQVVKLPKSSIFVSSGDFDHPLIIDQEFIKDKIVIYNTRSVQAKFVIDSETYDLVRVPDLLGVVEED